MTTKKYMDVWELSTLATFLLKPDDFRNKAITPNKLASHGNIGAHNVITSLKSWSDKGLIGFEMRVDDSLLHGSRIKDNKFTKFSDDHPDIYRKTKANKPIDYKEYYSLLYSLPVDVHEHIKLKITKIDKQSLKKMLEDYTNDFVADRLSTGKPAEPEQFSYLMDQVLEIFKKRYKAFGSRQILDYQDFKRAKPTDEAYLPFWEVVLCLYSNKYIKIIELEHARLTNKPFVKVQLLEEAKRSINAPIARPRVKTELSVGELTYGTDGRVRIKGTDLNLRFQLRVLLRLLMSKSPEILLLDELQKNQDIIKPGKYLKNPSNNIQKYISELRKAIGSGFTIRSDEQEGYKLLLSTDLKSE